MDLFAKISAIFQKSGIEISPEKLEVLKSELKDVKLDAPDASGKLTSEQFQSYLDAALNKIGDLTTKMEANDKANALLLAEIEANKVKTQSEKIKSLLAEAVKSGKLTPEEAKFAEDENAKGLYQKRLEKDYQEWSSEIEKRAGTPAPSDKKTDPPPASEKPGVLGSQISTKVMDYVNKFSK
jgi:polyhydroxyalkanoate synthesis regulator phasin